MNIRCPYCSYEGFPMISKKLSPQGWTLVLALLIFFFPLFWLPLVFDGLKVTVRQCPGCLKQIA